MPVGQSAQRWLDVIAVKTHPVQALKTSTGHAMKVRPRLVEECMRAPAGNHSSIQRSEPTAPSPTPSVTGASPRGATRPVRAVGPCGVQLEVMTDPHPGADPGDEVDVTKSHGE
jgi:hypothetical protein